MTRSKKRTPPSSRTGHALVDLTLLHLLEEGVAVGGLGVVGLFDFVPGGLLRVGTGLPFGDDAFQVILLDFCEEGFPFL